jgi:hypothetical protein
MADSTYNILEMRIVDRGSNVCDLYILIDNPTDFLPIGGWYTKTLWPDDPSPSIAAMQAALEQLGSEVGRQAFLTEWQQGAPDEQTQWQQDEIKTLREALTRAYDELARRQMGLDMPPKVQ